jgi:pimeloyl-ACP methyl ester carboxylesterase
MGDPGSWLMLRGLARERRHFGSFPDTFERTLPGARIMTMDLPGFGMESARESPATISAIVDDLRARFLAARTGDGPWSILALSLGGMVALNWAERFPDEWKNVVVVNTSAGDLSKPWERFSHKVWPRMPGLVLGEAVARERTILEVTSNSTSVDKDALAQQWAAWYLERAPRRRAFVRQLLAATRSRAPRRIQARLLVLTAKTDRLVSWRCSERIAQRLEAPLEIHDGAGHDLTLDAPEWVAGRVRAFVA